MRAGPQVMCAWRQLAFERAHANRPDADAKVHDALQLSKFCEGSVRPDESSLPTVFPPPASTYIQHTYIHLCTWNSRDVARQIGRVVYLM
jgi:hypothetical protein